MTKNREFYASTVDEAVAKAAADLGVDANEVSFKVLDEGNTGFLGIGARDARIVVEAEHLKQDDTAQEPETPATAPAPASEEPEAYESTPPAQEAAYTPPVPGSSTPG